ncbi:MAG: hypothetical protein QHI48_08260 [Bacteroidota bacterium]|nr:hypothetical protein [Bacteroidota bacterium]
MRLPERIRQLFELARTEGRRRFDPETRRCLIPRDTVWYAISLLASDDPDDRALGESLLMETPSEDGTHTPASLLALFFSPLFDLKESVRSRIRGLVRDELVHAAEVEWRDGNVNHPLGAYATLVLGGEIASAPWAVSLGGRRLGRLLEVSGGRRHAGRRQGALSEYNSLTYGALDLCFLSLVGAYSSDAEARACALRLERGLWLDAALHFHAPSMQFAGPHSRSYQDDTSGGYSGLHCVFFAVWGDRIALEPETARAFNHPSAFLQNALIALCPFHPPVETERIAFDKPFPLTIRQATYGESYHETRAGEGFDHEMYPGGWSELTTYMTRAYALGTASIPYANGAHSDALMVRIARRGKDGRQAHRSLFARGVFNEAAFGIPNLCHTTGTVVDESWYPEQGRTAICQHGNLAVVLYTPKRAGHGRVRSFRIDLVFTYREPFDALLAGGRAVTAFPAAGEEPAILLFADGDTLGAVIPLRPEPYPSPPAWTMEARRDHLVYSLWNYHGEEIEPTRDELQQWRNGFVIELAERSQFPSLGEFAEHVASLAVRERIEGDIRTVAVSGAEGEMVFRFDPRAERILSRTWNGEELGNDAFSVETSPSASFPPIPPSLFE